MIRMLLINLLKVMPINLLLKIVYHIPIIKRKTDFSGSYWMNDEDNYDKFKRAESTALDNRRELLERENSIKATML